MASEKMTVQSEVVEIIRKLAKQQGVEVGEALDRVLRMGISRHNALAKYAASKDEAPPAKKAKKVKEEAPPKKATKKVTKK